MWFKSYQPNSQTDKHKHTDLIEIITYPHTRTVTIENKIRVATAQGKQGIWFLIFPDRENTGNLPKNIKNMILHREFTFNTGKILKFQKLNVKPGLWWNIAIKFWLFDAKFQLVDNTIEFL